MVSTIKLCRIDTEATPIRTITTIKITAVGHLGLKNEIEKRYLKLYTAQLVLICPSCLLESDLSACTYLHKHRVCVYSYFAVTTSTCFKESKRSSAHSLSLPSVSVHLPNVTIKSACSVVAWVVLGYTD